MHLNLQSSEESASVPGPGPHRGIERVLLVEDSMLIALDAEDSLRACGVAEVVIAGSVAAALTAIADAQPDFAVLDYNLGNESSEPIARALSAANVAFCFATGYGDALECTRADPPYGVLKKPYSPADIADLMARVEADLRG
jgi:DNA-binding response OmpR family regulator